MFQNSKMHCSILIYVWSNLSLSTAWLKSKFTETWLFWWKVYYINNNILSWTKITAKGCLCFYIYVYVVDWLSRWYILCLNDIPGPHVNKCWSRSYFTVDKGQRIPRLISTRFRRYISIVWPYSTVMYELCIENHFTLALCFYVNSKLKLQKSMLNL